MRLCIVFGDLIDSMGISMSGAAGAADLSADEMAQMQEGAMNQMMDARLCTARWAGFLHGCSM